MNNPRVAGDQYDRGIEPAETAARKDREGSEYKHLPEQEKNKGDIDTSGGYTVDREGLLNNYAVEPEMYIDVPGDLREEQQEDKAERIQELKEINQDKQGELTEDHDSRGKGPGLV